MRCWSLLLCCLFASGCGSDVVTCVDDARCLRAGVQGSCESSPISASRFCVFADAACPSSQRWDSTAGDGLAGQCLGDTIAQGDMAMAALPQANGTSCTTTADCASGFCSDGVCCDRDCSADSCSACNVPGNVGTCTPISNGSAPATGHPSCGPDAKSTCMRDGTCDGKGACRKWQAGTECAASKCDSGTNQFTAAATCDGSGTCITPTAITCAPYLCKDAQNCYGQCTATPGQCSGTNTCTMGSCGPKGNGAICTSGTECGSGFCAQGVCCDSACTGTCQSCNIASKAGTCSFVVQGQPDPQGGCQTGTGADAYCSPGGCDGSGHCAVAAATTQCRAASCDASSNTYSPPVQCGGSATCPAANATACTAYRCAGNACGTTCNLDGDCLAGYFCSNHACVAQYSNGTGCSAGDQCASGNCTVTSKDCSGNPLNATKICCNVAEGGVCFCCTGGTLDVTCESSCSHRCL